MLQNRQTLASPSQVTSLPTPPTAIHPPTEGTRFLRDGHWWEVTDRIRGKAGGYCRCRPVCNIETRFFTEGEITSALIAEKKKLERKTVAQQGRGSGRVINLVQPVSRNASPHLKALKGGNKAECKLLAIGNRKGVKDMITTLYTIGFAHVNDWSPIQINAKSGDSLSIFTGHRFNV
jgi:hypothetical protein